jgi:superfamily II DNA or RNA helicase
MEKVLNYLNEIEEKANRIIERADDEKLVLQKDLDQRILDLEKYISDENKKKLDELQNELNKDLDNEITKLKMESKKQLEELETYFNTNHVTFVDTLFQKIVGA